MYLIRNISDRDAKLFFAQARKVEKEEIEEDMKAMAEEAARQADERESNEPSRSPTLVPPPRKGR